MLPRSQQSDNMKSLLFQYNNTILFSVRFTYEVSPVFILMEEVLLRKMQSIVGWSSGEGDGIFCPGNTMKVLQKWVKLTAFILLITSVDVENHMCCQSSAVGHCCSLSTQRQWLEAHALVHNCLFCLLKEAQYQTCTASLWPDTISTQR